MRDGFASLLVILTDNTALTVETAAILAPSGWLCRETTEIAAALPLIDGGASAILVDSDRREASTVARAVQGLPAPGNGVPILTIGRRPAALPSPGGHLTPPLDADALRDLLRQWAGPLDDHALRAPPFSARYRMIRLVGLDNANAMLARFRQTLAEAVETATRDPAAVPAHRLAGLSGMMGFAELNRLWARVDGGDGMALASAIAASRDAVAAIA